MKSKFVPFVALLLMAGAVALGTLAPMSCTTTQRETLKRVAVPLADLGLTYAVQRGYLEPGDSVAIANGLAVVVSEESGETKLMELARLGADQAVRKGVLQEGDRVLIQNATDAILIPADPEGLTSGKSPEDVLPPAGG